jgi:hypothetical protein
VAFAKRHNVLVLSDLAYAEVYFDDPPPSMLQVPGAMDVAVEFTSMSKTYSMPGWRIGFAVGNERIVAALAPVKSYLDYGAFTPIQVAVRSVTTQRPRKATGALFWGTAGTGTCRFTQHVSIERYFQPLPKASLRRPDEHHPSDGRRRHTGRPYDRYMTHRVRGNRTYAARNLWPVSQCPEHRVSQIEKRQVPRYRPSNHR